MRRFSVVRSPPTSAKVSGEYSSTTQPVPSGRARQATLDDDGTIACLSAFPHDPDANRDSLFQHFLGCLEFDKRAEFLNEGNEFWTQQINPEVSKLRLVNPAADQKTLQEDAKELVRKNIQALAVSIEAQFKRTEVLRRALAKESPLEQQGGQGERSDIPSVPGSPSLVNRVNQSRIRWRKSDDYIKGMREIQRWKGKSAEAEPTGIALENSEMKEDGRERVQEIVKELRGDKSVEEEITDYDLERDVNAYLIQYTRVSKPNTDTADSEQTTDLPSIDPKMRHLPTTHIEEDLKDVRFKGKFPDQRLSMDLLLRSAHSQDQKYNEDILSEESGKSGTDWNILSKKSCDKKDPTRLRYLHIPANNMEWVESAVAGYYDDRHDGEHPALRSGHKHAPATTKTQTLLRPQFWRGQLHGAQSGVVHARYMRPLCERISSSPVEIEDNPNNIVLFMPYMHWETDRMRNTVAKMVDDQSYKQLLKQEKKDLAAKKTRIQKREAVRDPSRRIEHVDEDRSQHLKTVFKLDLPKQSRERSLTGLVPWISKSSKGGIKIESDGRLRVSRKMALGQYLIDAARLYEAMSTFRDRRMVEKYLYNNPPLHPRRTLDQSHYWTLKTTKARDRDQVVYRGTNINLDLCHKFRQVPKTSAEKPSWKKALQEFDFKKLKVVLKEHDPPEADGAIGQTEQKPDKHPGGGNSPWFHWLPWGKKGCEHHWQWAGHWSKTDEHGCEHCTSEIKKISKLIMVDQLWMWVLDEQTIITSFPRRYGYNKYDLHGIHKSIRTRLANARNNQIRSIFDVALIILDECSNTFFDRTKAQDGQPQVMDIFSEAIGDVTNKHTISFQHVWHWTQKASDVYRSKTKQTETSDLHVPLLDIHPEGKLQREVKDILDELDIMINITRRQRDLIRRFCKHVENILDPEGRWRHGSEDQSRAPVEDDDLDEDRISASEEKPRKPNADPQGDMKEDQASEAQRKKATTDRQAKKKEEKRLVRKRRKKHLDWFRMQAEDLLCEVGDRIDELEGLRESARSTAQSVNDLLSLKQQQASVVQAWESVNQAEEAVRQGRSIMMFTIITIVFLPLSFMSSVFGMNNVDLQGDGNTWTLAGQLSLMFPVSIGIMAVSLIFAFHGLVRASIWSAYTYGVTWVAVHTGLYGLWLEYGNKNFRSASLMRETADKVHQLKEDVRKAKRRKMGDEAARKLSERRKEADTDTEGDEALVVPAANGAANGASNGFAPTENTGTGGLNRFKFRRGWLPRRKRSKKGKTAGPGQKPGTVATPSGARSPRNPRSPPSRGQSIAGVTPGITFADEQVEEEDEVVEEEDTHAGTSNMV